MKKLLWWWTICIKTIDNYGWKTFTRLSDWILDNYSSINIIWWIWVFLVIIFNLSDFRDMSALPGISENQAEVMLYSMFFLPIMWLYLAISFYSFEKKTRDYEKNLTKKWYRKFIEYEHKKNDIGFFSWLPYITTLIISIIAIVNGMGSIQVSIDIANGDTGIQKTSELYGIIWGWLWLFWVLFILYFFTYKFNQLWKRKFLEDRIYIMYRK